MSLDLRDPDYAERGEAGISIFEFVRHHLAYMREQEGLPFLEAWNRALKAIPRGATYGSVRNAGIARERKDAVTVLKWGRDFWQATYEGRSIGEVRTRPELLEPTPLEAVLDELETERDELLELATAV